MSIAVLVLMAKVSARNNFCAARQGSSPNSATAYSFETICQSLSVSQTQHLFPNKETFIFD